MDSLRAAVKGGWRPAKSLATDPHLASLRNREDFKQLLADLGWAPPKPLPVSPPGPSGSADKQGNG